MPGPRTKGKPPQECCSRSCATRLRCKRVGVITDKTCEVCGDSFTPSGGRSRREQRTCSRACGVLLRGQVPGGSRVGPPYRKTCRICGAEFDTKWNVQQFCNSGCKASGLRQWKQDYPSTEQGRARITAGAQRRRAVKRQAFVEDVDPRVVYERDKWRCHICKTRIRHSRKRWDPDGPSVDHLLPLALGGEHSYANVAAAHLRCNVQKHTAATGEQLALC